MDKRGSVTDYPDKACLHDLFIACTSEQDEHLLAFTINFSQKGSDGIRKSAEANSTAAMRIVRDLLKRAQGNPIALDTVLILESSKTRTEGLERKLHAHGWIRTKRSVKKAELESSLKGLKSQNIESENNAIMITDCDSRTGETVNQGWAIYITKEFAKNRRISRRNYSASGHTRTVAASLRQKRTPELQKLMNVFRDELIIEFWDENSK